MVIFFFLFLFIIWGESAISWKELKIRAQEIWDLVPVPKLTSQVVMKMSQTLELGS